MTGGRNLCLQTGSGRDGAALLSPDPPLPDPCLCRFFREDVPRSSPETAETPEPQKILKIHDPKSSGKNAKMPKSTS